MPVHSGAVAIVLAFGPAVKSIRTVDIAEKRPKFPDPLATVFRVARKVVIPPSTRMMVPKCTSHACLNYFPPHSNALNSGLTLPASGMVYTVPYKSFQILTANLSTKSTSLLCHMIVAIGDDLPEMVFHSHPDHISTQIEREVRSLGLPSEKKGKQNAKSPARKCRKQKVDVQSVLRNRQTFEKPTASVAAVHYKERESKELQMDRHEHVETVDSEAFQTDWKEQRNMAQSYDGYKQDILKVLEEFEHKCDGRLGRVGITKHCVELIWIDIQPIKSASHSAGPKEREFEKSGIEKMLRMNVIESEQSERATSPLVFNPKTDGFLRFCVD